MSSSQKRDWSKILLGWGSAATASIIGLHMLDLLPVEDTTAITNAVMLVILGSVLFAEFVTERQQRNKHSTGNYIMIVLASFAIISGVVEFFVGLWRTFTFPDQILGAMGLLYIILAVVLIVKIYR